LFRIKTKNTIIDHDLIYISCSILSAPLVHMDSSPLCALYNRMLQQILPPKIFWYSRQNRSIYFILKEYHLLTL
jgi:hypothetical protein